MSTIKTYEEKYSPHLSIAALIILSIFSPRMLMTLFTSHEISQTKLSLRV
jgi:hypothetical protein